MAIVEYKPGDPFPGKIGRTVDDSSPAWPAQKRAETGTPNVLIYVPDDISFGQLAPCGQRLETQHLAEEET